MDKNLGCQVMSPIVHEIIAQYRAKEITFKSCRSLLAFCVESVDSYDGDIEDMFTLVDNVCTVCLKDFPESNLVSWSPEDTYESTDPRNKYKDVAFNNCFGPTMLGGKVCLSCAMRLATLQEGKNE